MGNRMNSMKDMKRSSAATGLHSKDALFVPILPFLTPSNLGALYILGPELGRGQFGVIRSCTSHSSGVLFACKSISKLHLRTTRDIEDVVREVRIMKHLSNPTASHISPNSIVRLHDVIEDEAFVHLIMELCCGGELFNRIRKKKCYPEAQSAIFMKSLLETLQFCHSMGIMHRDIKPENILLLQDSDTSAIKLADFGLALEFSPGQKFSGMAGSSYYMAPEVLQGEYSEEIDMWSAGVILYILLSGVPPFLGATEQHIFHAIQKGELSFSSSPWDEISASAKDMISQMLHPDPKSRLTPAQALKHPWIIHHTKNDKNSQLNAPFNIRPSSAILQQHESARNSSSRTLPSSTPRNQTLSGAGMTDDAKPDLNKVFVDLIAGMNRNMLYISNSVDAKILQGGWTCTVLSQNGSEETLVVDVGQGKYLVSHDKIRKRIGWKFLKDKSVSANLHSVGQF